MSESNAYAKALMEGGLQLGQITLATPEDTVETPRSERSGSVRIATEPEQEDQPPKKEPRRNSKPHKSALREGSRTSEAGSNKEDSRGRARDMPGDHSPGDRGARRERSPRRRSESVF